MLYFLFASLGSLLNAPPIGSMNLTILWYLVSGIRQYLSFCDWLLSLSIMSLSFMHVVPDGSIPFFLKDALATSCMYVCVCEHIYSDTQRNVIVWHWTFSLFLHLVCLGQAQWISSKDLLYVIEPCSQQYIVQLSLVERVDFTLSILSTHMQNHWRKGVEQEAQNLIMSFRAFCLEKIYFCHDYSSSSFSLHCKWVFFFSSKFLRFVRRCCHYDCFFFLKSGKSSIIL